MERAQYALNLEEAPQARKKKEAQPAKFRLVAYGNSVLVHADCLDWLNAQEDNSVHAVVTDPRTGSSSIHPNSRKNSALAKEGSGAFRRPLMG